MSKKNKSIFRFGVAASDGRVSGSYKLWTEKNEVYLLERVTGNSFKVSLHKSGNWQISFTSEFFADKNKPNQKRHIKRWTAPVNNIGNGVTLAFRIRIPESELMDLALNNTKKITWIKSPEKEHFIEIDLIFTKKNATFPEDWPLKNFLNASLLKEMILLNGDSLWIIYFYQPMSKKQIILLDHYREEGRKMIKKIDHKPRKPKLILMGKEKDNSRQFVEVAINK